MSRDPHRPRRRPGRRRRPTWESLERRAVPARLVVISYSAAAEVMGPLGTPAKKDDTGAGLSLSTPIPQGNTPYGLASAGATTDGVLGSLGHPDPGRDHVSFGAGAHAEAYPDFNPDAQGSAASSAHVNITLVVRLDAAGDEP